MWGGVQQHVAQSALLRVADVYLGDFLGERACTVFSYADDQDTAAVIGQRDDVLTELHLLLIVLSVDLLLVIQVRGLGCLFSTDKRLYVSEGDLIEPFAEERLKAR